MQIDLIVLIVLLVFVAIYSRKFSDYIFGIASIDILFRVLNFLKNNLPSADIKRYIGEYVPASIPSIINKYISSSISEIIVWVYVIIMIIFLYFCINIFIKRKK